MLPAGVASAETCTLLSTGDCAECLAGNMAIGVACMTTTDGQACPSGLQAQIDDMYVVCDGLEFAFEESKPAKTWEEGKADTKATVEACGCGGAAQAAPLFAAMAAVANHFLN